MKAGWEVRKLKELCDDFKADIVDGPFGANLKREHYISNGTPVLKIQNIKPFQIVLKKMDFVSEQKASELARHSYRNGDIIITKLGQPLGVSAIVSDLDPGIIVADLVRVRASKVDTQFLCYQLNSPLVSKHLNSLQKGTTRPRVQISAVRDLPINLPPLAEQKRIVSILDEAFEGLDCARENAEANLKSAQELFDATLESAFDPYGDTEWEVKALGSVCEIAPKKALVKKILTDEQLVSFVPMNHLGILRRHFTAKEDRPLLSVYKGYTYFCDDDVIIAKITPCFENGKMGLASGMTNGVGFGSSEFVPIRGQGKTLPTYLFYFLLRNNFRENGARVMTGAVGHKRVPVEYIENLPIPLPPLEEQKRISFRLDKASSQHNSLKEKYTTKLQDISDLRQSLLQKAFAGELI